MVGQGENVTGNAGYVGNGEMCFNITNQSIRRIDAAWKKKLR
jgi:hypothetical protein